jgi:cyanophycinase
MSPFEDSNSHWTPAFFARLMASTSHKRLLGIFAILVLAGSLPCSAQSDHPYKYFRVGNPTDSANAKPRAGYALMGGGSDLDEAFRWLCDRAGGGDLLVLRATGTDDYNRYIQKLCRLNSVATLVIPNRAAADDPFVAKAIEHAAAVFISGGDQSNYINFWMNSPVQTALNNGIARGIPLGGTSAGLAVMGEWAYSAQGDKPDDPNLSGAMALANPFSPRVTLVHGFLNIPVMTGAITDTHFAKRDRMGRLLVFLARLDRPDGKSLSASPPSFRGVGIEERAAFLLEPDGTGRVIGHGSAYFIETRHARGSIEKEKPLTFGTYSVQKVAPGRSFNLKTWTREASGYELSVRDGKINSTQSTGAVY